jgi:hypothetical protein
MKKVILHVFLFLIANLAYSQTEYLVTVDPTDCTFEAIHALPDIHYIAIYPNFTTFDEGNKRYILKGKDFNNNLKLYTINALTGAMLFNPLFPLPEISEDNLVEFQYDTTGNKLYALHWKNQEQTEYLVSLSLETGEYNLINALPVADPVTIVPPFTQRRFSAFDKIHQNYIFSGADTNGNKKLFTVDVNTGTILFAPEFPVVSDPSDVIMELQFDNSTSHLYGLFLDVSESKFYIVTINQQNGQYTIVCAIPGLLSVDTSNGYTVFDEINHKFIFHGLATTGWKLFAVDVNTGINTTANFFPEINGNDNLIELQMDNTTGVLYGLHWIDDDLGIETHEKNRVRIAPNPASTDCSIQFDTTYTEIKLELYNSLGQIVRSEKIVNADSYMLDLSTLNTGIYILKLSTLGTNITIQKLIIQ